MSVTELPAEGGADASTKGFIEGFGKEVQWMASTFNRDNSNKDYSGKWPVYTFGVSRQSKADITGHVEQRSEDQPRPHSPQT
jgi:hypothetical protein